MKRCTNCSVEKGLESYSSYRKGDRVLLFAYCKDCRSVKFKEYYRLNHPIIIEKERARQDRKRINRKNWYERHKGEHKTKPDHRFRSKISARVYYAVKKGKIEKKTCEKCGDPKVHAHHYLGYEPEHWLDVKWYCPKHHQEQHRKYNYS